MVISNLPIRFIVLAATFLAWVAPAMAGFSPQHGSSPARESISGYYGTASYNMSDLNHLIELGNAGSSIVDLIERGTEYGGRLTYNFRPHLTAGISYSAMKASTGYGPFPDSDEYIEIDAKGSLLEVSLTFRDKFSPKLFWGLTAAIGRVSAKGRIDGKDSETEIHYEFVGSDFSFSANALVEYQLSRSTFIWLEGGVREADTGSVKNGNQIWFTPDGSKMTFSYSGAFLRVGLRLSSLFLEE